MNNMNTECGSSLDSVESRLACIERRVYGKSNPSYKEKEDASSEVRIPPVIFSTWHFYHNVAH